LKLNKQVSKKLSNTIASNLNKGLMETQILFGIIAGVLLFFLGVKISGQPIEV
jgi:hypothetical protein